MARFNIVHGQNPNNPNDYDLMAISERLNDPSSDFFKPSQTELTARGYIEIDGDTDGFCYVPDYFSIK